MLLLGLLCCSMLKEEGMDNVVARHHRLAEGTRKAVEGWGLELLCAHPRSVTDNVAITAIGS